MKLKFLFDNRDLAEMLVSNWNYDKSSLEMFKYYRISSNAIYPFKIDGKIKLLRFAPVSEKDKSSILAELEFIKYLNSSQYPALRNVLSKNGEEMVTAHTPWGDYFATAFDRVPGVQIGDTDFNGSIMYEVGKTLGKLHRLSSKFSPINRRWSHDDVFIWIKSTLSEFHNQEAAAEEVNLLQTYFSNLPQSNENYGLVHYDFEFDNVFYDETTQSCHVIDFDDAMYHWYVMDIEQSLDSIMEEIEPSRYEHAKELFLNGYRSEYTVTEEMLTLLPVFRRFANLYNYARVLRSSADTWDNEPEWLVNLRVKLSNSIKSKSMKFGAML
jgi:Ser/Thr protein kinase RdoA (MazF antagonist)